MGAFAPCLVVLSAVFRRVVMPRENLAVGRVPLSVEFDLKKQT